MHLCNYFASVKNISHQLSLLSNVILLQQTKNQPGTAFGESYRGLPPEKALRNSLSMENRNASIWFPLHWNNLFVLWISSIFNSNFLASEIASSLNKQGIMIDVQLIGSSSILANVF